MKQKEVCEHCVPYGWDEERIWFKKLGRKFGISSIGLGWLNFIAMLILTTRVPVDPGRSWGTYVVVVIYVGLLLTLLSWLAFHVPTWIYRAIQGKHQAAFNLDKIEHIHDMDRKTNGFAMKESFFDRHYVRLGFGLLRESAIMRLGKNDDEKCILKTSRNEARMLTFRSRYNKTKIYLALDDLLRLVDQGIFRPYELVEAALDHRGLVDKISNLQRRVQGLEGGEFCEQVARYLRAIIHDLKSSKRAHQSKVGERTRLLLEAVSERLELREANPDDQLGVIELETYIKQKSEVREPTNA